MQIVHENGATDTFDLAGSVLTVGELALDLAELQTDVERRVIVWQSGGTEKTCAEDAYRAVVVIPAAIAVEVEGDDESSEWVREPLDLDAVELRVWPEAQQEST